MENNNLDVVLNIKPHKVSKYLKVMFQDISEDMQNKVAPASVLVYKMLSVGDAKNALIQVDKYLEAMKQHVNEIEHLRVVMVRDILDHLEVVKGMATRYTGPDGENKWSSNTGDKVTMEGITKSPEPQESPASTEVLKDSLDLKEDGFGVDGGSK